MSEITGTGIPVAHEAYAFACMRCGYGWEQAYDIEHHVDATGQEFIVYKAGGERVPSPLSSPTCMNCGGHVVRIMRSGQVSSVLDSWEQAHHPNEPRTRRPVAPAGPIGLAGPIGQDLERQELARKDVRRDGGPKKRDGGPKKHASGAGPEGDAPGPVHVEEPHRRRLSDLFHRKPPSS
ncbi:hypothetical protein J7E93_01330 [Streptomyces sp. ISL-36]|uniref:hypothetical protein n=1 Tax=Streptomyces sp. ISL-36 TaxID=2819182 RepID=UPI001BE83F60|nr:hypothetical protein [Streptomyces sp. ISL-36]MBT2438789.1 hypothetical protein [Streptomyces sp. ISL-36]